MDRILYIFPCFAILLEGLLLWRFLRYRLFIRYPHLTVFVVFDLLSNVVLFFIHRFRSEWFGEAYWRIASVSLFLRFLVNWEFFRGVFPRRSTLHDIAWKMLLIVELFTLPLVVLVGWQQASSLPYLYLHFSPAVEQYFCLAQAILLLTPAFVAWYYGVSLGRNLLGLCFGFGGYLFVRSVDFASLQVFRGFAPYWRLLTPSTFIAMIAVWLWAFWEYAPSPEQASLEKTQQSQWKTEWERLWNRTISLLRRGV